MMVLVTGAGGFLGRHVVSRLLKGGHSVRAVIRPASRHPSWPDTVDIFRADLKTHDRLGLAFDGVEAVVHLAAATSGSEDHQFMSSVVATERFLQAMVSSSVKRLLHVSSLVVYDWTRAVVTLDENTPLLDTPYDMGAYTIAKVWQERIVRRIAIAHELDLTIMRPGFVWGPHHAEIGGMGRKIGPFYVMFGPSTRLPLCHVSNCADCIVRAIERPDLSINQSFNVIDGDDVRVWRYVREHSRRSGDRGYMIPIPYGLGLLIAHFATAVSRGLFGKKGKLPSLLVPRRYQWQFKPLRFSNQKLRTLLNWGPVMNFEECLHETYQANVEGESAKISR